MHSIRSNSERRKMGFRKILERFAPEMFFYLIVPKCGILEIKQSNGQMLKVLNSQIQHPEGSTSC